MSDPRLFNYVIFVLYILAALRWGCHGSWKDASYWLGAAWLTATVTWGYKH